MRCLFRKTKRKLWLPHPLYSRKQGLNTDSVMAAVTTHLVLRRL